MANKVFDRYTSTLMHVRDRMFHNLVEWSPFRITLEPCGDWEPEPSVILCRVGVRWSTSAVHCISPPERRSFEWSEQGTLGCDCSSLFLLDSHVLSSQLFSVSFLEENRRV
jgi:hypothetical protein